MKTIKLLPDHQATESDGSIIENLKITHAKFLLDRLPDPAFTSDFDGLVRAVIIRAKLLDLKGDTLELEDQDWERLCTACKRGYNAALAHNFVDFIHAVLKAE